MTKSSKGYDFARSEHARLSIPYNRARVREGLEGKLLAPTGQETPGQFVKAVDESAQMLKKSTGNPRYQRIEDVLNPEESQIARNVSQDLERLYRSQHPMQPTDIPGSGNLASADVTRVNLLNRYVAIANSILSGIGKSSVEPKVDALNARLLLNPQELGRFLQPQQQIPPRYYEMLQRALQSAGPVAGAQGARQF